MRNIWLPDYEQDEYRGWLWCAHSMAFPTRTEEEVLDTNQPKLKWLSNFQLIVKRLIKSEKEPVGVAMNV